MDGTDILSEPPKCLFGRFKALNGTCVEKAALHQDDKAFQLDIDDVRKTLKAPEHLHCHHPQHRLPSRLCPKPSTVHSDDT